MVGVCVGAGEGALVFFSTVVGAAGVEVLDCVESFAAVGLGDCEGLGEALFLDSNLVGFTFIHTNWSVLDYQSNDYMIIKIAASFLGTYSLMGIGFYLYGGKLLE